MQIGDIFISEQKTLSFDGSGNFVFEGPDIKVETTDKKRALHLLVLADHIVAQQRRAGNGTVQLNGNVRYTLTEQTAQGERVIQGTSRRADYAQAAKTLRLLDDVNATLTDPVRFEGPAALRVGSLIAPGEGRYKLAGNAAFNDIRFTPRPPAPRPLAAKPNATTDTKQSASSDFRKRNAPPFQPGEVHARGFATGSIDTGREARFDGPLVTVESDNPQTKSRNVFKAPHFVAGLGKGKDSIEATGGVTFDCRRVDAQGNTQTLAGTAGQILARHDQPFVLEGGVNASLTDPAALKEPATLTADRVTITQGADPRYVVTGSPDHTRLSFAPRTAPTSGAKPGNAKPAAQPDANGANLPARPADAVGGNTSDAANPPIINAAPPEEEANIQPAANAPGGTRQALQTAPNTPKNTPFVIGDIVVTGFATATYAPEKSLIVEGPRVHFVSSDPATKNDAEILTPRLEADFVASIVKGSDGKTRRTTTLREARATNGVTYKFQQPLKKGDMQTIQGTGSTATYTDVSGQSQTIKVMGVARVNVTTPDETAEGIGGQPDDMLTYDLITHKFEFISPQKTAVTQVAFRDKPAAPAVGDNATAKKTTKKKRK